jgi:photosystem II stability/assembly factor-like uncharacterized protein
MFRFFIRIVVFFCLLAGIPQLHAQYWKKAALPPGFDNNYWLDVFFLPSNPQFGWVSGYSGKVLRTTDGGSTWNGYNISGAGMLESIHFPSASVGYTSGPGGIWKSTNGGISWVQITPLQANNLWGCYFNTPDTGYVIGGGCNGTRQQFFRTNDGGATWQLTETTIASVGMCDLILDKGLDTGYAAGSGYIWRTTDRGVNWNLFSQSNTVRAWQEELAMNGNSILVPYSGSDCSGGGGGGGMCYSTDMGNSWQRMATPGSMFGTYLTSPQTGWSCGMGKLVYHTTNAGLTWQLKNCGISGSLDDIWMFNDSSGWVVGEGVYQLSPGGQEVLPQPRVFYPATCIPSIRWDTITVRNRTFVGTAVTITIAGTNASEFVPLATAFVLGPCEERQIPVRFQPTGAGIRQATAAISFSTPLQTMYISLEGLADQIDLGGNQTDEIKIDPIICGVPRDTILTLTNQTPSVITIAGIGNPDQPNGQQTDWLINLPAQIQPGGSLILPIRVNMTDTGLIQRKFILIFGRCEKIITITSRGISPVYSGPQNIQMLAGCNAVTDTIVQIRNEGNAPLIIAGYQLKGPDSAFFRILNTGSLPLTVQPGASAPLHLRFIKPDSYRQYIAAVYIVHSDSVSGRRPMPAMISLNGMRGIPYTEISQQIVQLGEHCIDSIISAPIRINRAGQTGALQVLSVRSAQGIARIMNTLPAAVQDTLVLQIQVQRSVPGPYTDTLYVQTNSCDDTLSIIIQGNAIHTLLSFGADTIIRAMADQGIPTLVQQIIYSAGTAVAEISRMQLRSGISMRLIASLPDPAILLPGQSGIISIEARAGMADTVLYDTLCVYTVNRCEYSICIPIEVRVRQARISFSQQILRYRVLCSRPPQRQSFTIYNRSQLADTILTLSISPAAGIFRILNLPTLPYILRSGDSLILQTEFMPPAQGIYRADIQSSTAASERNGFSAGQVQLYGEWQSPELLLQPDSIDAGALEICAPIISLPVLMRNMGMAADTLMVRIKNAKPWLILPQQMMIVPAQSQNIQYDIQYNPALTIADIPWQDTVQLISARCGTEYTIPIRGITTAARLTAMPIPLDAGSIKRDDSATLTLVITNPGKAAIPISRVQMLQNLPEFLLLNNVQGIFVKPMDTIHLHIKALALREGSSPVDTIVIYSALYCTDSIKVPIRMNVPREEFRAMISTQNYTVPYGDTVTIQITLQGDISRARIDSLQFNMALDGRLLALNEIYPPMGRQINDSLFTWTLPAAALPPQGGIIAWIKGRGMIAAPRQCALEFQNIKPYTNRNVQIQQQNGTLQIDPYCNGIALGIGLRSIVVMRTIPPAPSSTIMLGLRSAAPGLISTGIINLYNSTGRKIYSQSISAGEQEMIWSAPVHTAPGLYLAELISDGYTQRVSVLVSE